jgi:tRNA dimethylallyltransferase
MKPGVLLLAGSTASGKTELAIELARTFDGEIVGADSRQIYRGMPIGTASPSSVQLAAVPHHLVGFLDPTERYSAARFAADAVEAIRAVHARGKRAIVVGGTGFYLRALRGGVELAPQYDVALRDRLAREARLHPPEFLHDWLARHDAHRAAAIHPRDTYRVLRALEIALSRENVVILSGARSPSTSLRVNSAEGAVEERRTLQSEGIEHLLVFLDVPIAEIDERIARRSRRMLDEGFVDEAERVGEDAVAASAVGYLQALAYQRGFSTEREMLELLERSTRRYARRQRVWFRGEPDAVWLSPEAVAPAVREKLAWASKSR